MSLLSVVDRHVLETRYVGPALDDELPAEPRLRKIVVDVNVASVPRILDRDGALRL